MNFSLYIRLQARNKPFPRHHPFGHQLLFESRKRSQLSIRAHNEALPSPRCASAIQIVRPLVLRIVDHLRCRFARFKLCAHFLDLRGLLVQTLRHSVHSSLLLRDGRFLFCHCGL